MIVYSYFHKGGGIPKNRTERDLMASTNNEPYSTVPTSQQAQQEALRPNRVNLDYRRADQPPIALIEDQPPMEESSSASPLPNSDLPADHWRNTGKGKRPPPQRASRQPHKYARSDDREYPLSRTAQSSEPIIPLPPNAQNTAPKSKSSTRPNLTPGEAGVPAYKGDEYQPLTRAECTSYYKGSKARKMPKAREPLSDDGLIRLSPKYLTKETRTSRIQAGKRLNSLWIDWTSVSQSRMISFMKL